MASAVGIAFNSFLCRRNFLHKQVINIVRKCTIVQLKEQSNEITETLSPLLSTIDVSQDLCLRVRNDIINKHNVSEQAVDTRILYTCMKEQKPEIGKAYMKFVQSNGYPLNIISLGTWLQLYGDKTPASDSEEREIINIYDKIEKEYQYIPARTLRHCIIALCRTHKWKKTLELIEDVYKEKSDPFTLSHIVTAAFRNGEISTGLKLLYDKDDPQMVGHKYPFMFNAYLDYYLQKKPAEFGKGIEKIFKFWKKFDVVPIKNVIDNFANACNKAGWKANYVTIKRDGNCYCCGKQLSQMVIDDTVFKKLAKSIVSKAIVESDIFQSTTPVELNKFKNFIHKTKPYDIVIDGLNVTRGKTDTVWLKDMVNFFSQNNKKILVIARQHMYPVSKWIMPMENVYVYFLQNITEDDPYILYATLMSGINAKFVSYDFFRQYFHKLENHKIRKIFRRWQYTHQYLWSYNSSLKKSVLEEPWLHESYAQCNDGYWHIPYRLDSEKNKLLYRPVDTWLCVQGSTE